ncbi:uncharacterized protein LOC107261607 [Ricinus communis]|uniref:uncharacterized protein LOC107261607 n=1 Tax=Ricinus communis TaxID=3988 RepID=UPI00201AD1B4|nr:uncharacterized protein LOC107261607 [Ricinus communis]
MPNSGRTTKASSNSVVPKWYQSFAMDQRVTRLEKTIESFNGNGELLLQLVDTVNKLNIRMEEIASSSQVSKHVNEVTEHSTSPSRMPGVQQNNREGQSNQSTNSFMPKTLKIDSPCFDGQSDPTIWLFKAEQFFQLHDIPTSDRVALASFHFEGDAYLWYQ